MRLNILSDAHWESRLDAVLRELSATGYRDFFASRDYGSGLRQLVIVLMCRDLSLAFKQRIRFRKKDRSLYLDVMLDLDEMRQATQVRRKQTVVEHLCEEVPRIVQERALPDFDEVSFVADFQSWLHGIQ